MFLDSMRGVVRRVSAHRRPLAVVVITMALAALRTWELFPARPLGPFVVRFEPGNDCVKTGTQRTYATRFPLTEDPISEHGAWLVSGGDFANVRTSSGVAFGTQPGNKKGAEQYDDSTALLSGMWGPDQFVQIQVYHTGARMDRDYNEVEIRLRSSISPTSNTGYEIQCRVGRWDTHGYVQVGKVNGPRGDFAPSFDAKFGVQFTCRDGDLLAATIVGTTLKAYVNGTQVLQAQDSSYATGAPGIGLFHANTQSRTTDYGISRVIASDSVPTLEMPMLPCLRQ